MSFIKTFFKPTKVDPTPIAVRDAFNVARARYEQSQSAIRPYITTFAKHRAVIMRARAHYDQTKDAGAYEKELVAYSAPCTEAELDAHTVKMESLTVDFDTFTVAFAALNPADDFYITAHACFNVYCETYKIAVDAYTIAALSAIATAEESKSQAAKNDANAWLFETIAANSGETNQNAAEAKAAAFKVKAIEDASRATLLGQKARIAETKAKEFLTKAEKALGMSQ